MSKSEPNQGSKERKDLDPADAERRADEVLRRMLNTPPKKKAAEAASK